MNSKSPKIMVLYASYGDGHYQASKAIEASFHQKGIHHVILLDLMAMAHPVINGLTKFVYMQSFRTLPAVYGWVYNITKDMQPDTPFSNILHSFGMRKLAQMITDHEPDLIIHTFPQLVMPKLMKKTGLSLPLVNIVTDFDLHGRWIHPEVDRYYVATEDLRNEAVSRGIPEHRVLASGIPIKPDFEQTHEPDPRFTSKLDSRKKTVLLMAGAYGVMQGIRDMIQPLVDSEEFQVIAACGKNTELQRILQEQYGDRPNFQVFGFVNEVARLMQTCDCIITKPGGITLSESLASRLPMFLYRPVPGQELNNALYLESKGIASVAYTPSALVHQVKELFAAEDNLLQRQERIELLRRPNSADVIVNDILEQWFSTEETPVSVTADAELAPMGAI
ncbi:glycosyltransferase [Paenibacillus zeisoli]|uniref:Glycosyltransferase n=1 Tax=Paenibacillus zeisoli TaxID=2496267 RepID=A0A3S1DXF7_9BACL|nr:glycosyltransferase [Paenibacillus zeisoli]RUT31623.1 glycosyltransferase [Paenibacillus zeisoli]